MYSPHPPRPSYPPRPGAAPRESDESLVAQLGGRPDAEAARPFALLLARHWQPTYDYSVICLGSSAHVASMAAAAAFRQVLESLRRRPSAEALRPRLLAAVRDTVKAWSADDGISGVLPELRKAAGGRGMRAVKSTTPGNRELAERSFRGLPGAAQCLLWHTDVEAEPISVPAGLLAMDPGTAEAALEHAREQFRVGCVRAHRDLAPAAECRFYNRLLDIPIRRGGALLPDVRKHLLECRYCRDAAAQLSLCRGSLGVLLSEAVLGRGARRYLESRPGRGVPGTRPAESVRWGGRRPEGGRHRLLPGTTSPGPRFTAYRSPSKPVLTGLALVSVAVLSTILATGLSSDDGRAAGPGASMGATGSQAQSRAPSPLVPSAAPPPPANSAGFPGYFGQARLRNAGTDLCLDIRGGEAKPGAGTRMSDCSSGKNQQWSYGTDGFLRSFAEPELCLDPTADDGATALTRCMGPTAPNSDDQRYDLTVQGQLLPRWQEGLAVVPTSGEKNADVVVKIRDGSVEQRWVLKPKADSDSAPRPPGADAVHGKYAAPPTRPAGSSRQATSPSTR